ncbi:MAG: LemA family protein [Candidatus Macondimonas sp.]|jgi:LemA protein
MDPLMVWVVLAAIALVGIIYVIVIYNNLVRLKHNVSKAWSNIDVLLRQRHDELPKLVETCRRYMQHERETLERVISARTAVGQAREKKDMAALSGAESLLRTGLGQLFAVAEQYPELRADASFQHLRERITGLENAIADRREFYNDSVNRNNIRIETFPDVILARFFRFESADLLEFDAEDTADVSLGSLFES